MNSRIVSVIRTIARRTIPQSLRRKAWDLFVGSYFNRASIKAIIHHARANAGDQSILVQRLIGILERHQHRPVFDVIRNELDLDFRGFSCQDLIACIYFNGKPSGYFVDIGAFDGVEISNTYALEQLGWQGICVEPIPEIYRLLQQNRKCHSYNVAISSATGSTADFLKVSKLQGLSGLDQQMPERIRQGLQLQGLEIERTTVNIMTFDELMKNHGDIHYIDFLSIDVEGGELDVLATIDFDRFQFGLITIENNVGIMSGHPRCGTIWSNEVM